MTSTLYPQRNPAPSSTEKMSIVQTFRLAHKARGKLSAEASRQDHNLRLLVGHANLLDSLMIHLADAEAQQERWYTNTIQGYADEEDMGSLPTDYDSDSSDSDSECSDDEDEGEYEDDIPSLHPTGLHYTTSPRRPLYTISESDDEDYESYDEEDLDDFSPLERTTSHRPPSLCSDYSDEEDDDVATPPSSPQQPLEHIPVSTLTKDRAIHAVTTSSYYHDSQSRIHDDALIDDHHNYFGPATSTLISTY
ncbi:hypothetical protein EX30DRAFT_221064 [Ascodesmis nigricans]|uniref:Uncharacterized protein n=1 Tax=Ascodesmis nigricans TaxID=341454 RepID=A0A4V3SJ20_9PEZI|nr:hypothetical protein EX30DRAFT_221064 [Ascodesmis nigricans]